MGNRAGQLQVMAVSNAADTVFASVVLCVVIATIVRRNGRVLNNSIFTRHGTGRITSLRECKNKDGCHQKNGDQLIQSVPYYGSHG